MTTIQTDIYEELIQPEANLTSIPKNKLNLTVAEAVTVRDEATALQHLKTALETDFKEIHDVMHHVTSGSSSKSDRHGSNIAQETLNRYNKAMLLAFIVPDPEQVWTLIDKLIKDKKMSIETDVDNPKTIFTGLLKSFRNHVTLDQLVPTVDKMQLKPNFKEEYFV